MNTVKRIWIRHRRLIIGGVAAVAVAAGVAFAYHSTEARAFIQSLLPAKQAAFNPNGMKALGKGREQEVPKKPPNK